MGSFLDKPVTEKSSHSGVGNDIAFAVSSMQGWRTEMEDAHTTQLGLPAQPEAHFFAIFDGHGGKTVSIEGSKRLLPVILETEQYRSGNKNSACLAEALYAGFIHMDDELKAKNPRLINGADHSGSTVISLFVTPTHYIFGNCGDSRAILSRGGICAFTTKDHKPTDPTEFDRVKKAGGFIDMGRVCGNLAVSRALGDFQYKDTPHLTADRQKITAAPDVSPIERSPLDEFIILACDGIWDVMSNQQAINFVASQLKANVPLPVIPELLLDHCLEKNSKDNMSVIIITFPNAPKPVPGYVVPTFHDPEDDARKRQEEQESLLIKERLMMMVASSSMTATSQDGQTSFEATEEITFSSVGSDTLEQSARKDGDSSDEGDDD